jgi:hypothetical protein
MQQIFMVLCGITQHLTYKFVMRIYGKITDNTSNKNIELFDYYKLSNDSQIWKRLKENPLSLVGLVLYYYFFLYLEKIIYIYKNALGNAHPALSLSD